MALLYKLDRAAHMFHHARPHHHDTQPSPRKTAHGDLLLDGAQPGALGARLLDDTNVVQLLEQDGFLLEAEGGVGRELGEEVGELAEAAAQGVVLAIVERVGEVVAAADGVFAVGGRAVGFVGDEVDFAEEFGFMVFQFPDHCVGCGGRASGDWRGVWSKSMMRRSLAQDF